MLNKEELNLFILFGGVLANFLVNGSTLMQQNKAYLNYLIILSVTASRVRPKLGFGYGFGTETAKFLGFGMVSVTAVTRILVSSWFRLRP